MKESTKYIVFFSKYAIYYLVGGALGLVLGLSVYFIQPIQYKQMQLFELKQLSNPIPQMEKLADEIVAQVRSENVKKEMNLKSELVVYKPGPFSIQVELLSENKNSLDGELVRSYMLKNFEVEARGEIVALIEKPSLLYFLGLQVLICLLLVFLYSLVNEYFSQF